ncbi:MAG: UDP-N-acetylglucosamine 1-carboxyvinyltransferase [Candidatus Dependentiae bacterium]|nr:UDP-N-acetylglucosamine 1-carboxyvinyltransferase [Candidatus Dependentiae bacterium]
MQEYIVVEQSLGLQGRADLVGAKNAVLVIMASLLLTAGKSTLSNVPASQDVFNMTALLESLGATVVFNQDEHTLFVDTSGIHRWRVLPDIMKKMRASVLVMGPLLARFGRAELAMPGGCLLGARPIDYHLKNFEKMGVSIAMMGDELHASCSHLSARRIVLEYPSVGATENIMMAATLVQGTTTIINAALEPEVYDLIEVLQKMGAQITVTAPATITIEGVSQLHPISHAIIPDRLETGTLLIATAITGGTITLPQARADHLDLVLYKLDEMGHTITIGSNNIGIMLQATQTPKAVSFKTTPYPGFPTDLQAPMMVAQCLAEGTSIIEETVFENRLLHVPELQKMGAIITVKDNKATVKGVGSFRSSAVMATDIRASCALVLAGMAAHGGTTVMSNTHHFKRGYEALEKKLNALGARISFIEE